MSQKVQKILAEILTKDSKKNSVNSSKNHFNKENLDEEKIKAQKNIVAGQVKNQLKNQSDLSVSDEEQFKIIIKIIRENISRFMIVSFYFLVSLIAIFKLAFVVISYIKVFFNGIFSV